MARTDIFILASERDDFAKVSKEFIHSLIWSSNLLDGYDIKEIRKFEQKLDNHTFRVNLAMLVGEMIENKLFNDETLGENQ